MIVDIDPTEADTLLALIEVAGDCGGDADAAEVIAGFRVKLATAQHYDELSKRGIEQVSPGDKVQRPLGGPCTCHIEDTGTGESGPHIEVSYDRDCPAHQLEIGTSAAAELDRAFPNAPQLVHKQDKPSTWSWTQLWERGYISAATLYDELDAQMDRAYESAGR